MSLAVPGLAVVALSGSIRGFSGDFPLASSARLAALSARFATLGFPYYLHPGSPGGRLFTSMDLKIQASRPLLTYAAYALH